MPLCKVNSWLIDLQLTDFGAAENGIPLSKEDERSAALARRAQRGDYDDGAKIYSQKDAGRAS